MVTINDCTVRYQLGAKELIEHDIGYEIRFVLNSIRDLIPEYVFHSDDEYVYVYFTFPLDRKYKQIIQGFTGGIDFFWREEKLGDML